MWCDGNLFTICFQLYYYRSFTDWKYYFCLQELKKHWFVLAGNSLRYYQDAKAEEANSLDGRIDLSTCHEVSEVATHRNYGFKVKVSIYI